MFLGVWDRYLARSVHVRKQGASGKTWSHYVRSISVTQWAAVCCEGVARVCTYFGFTFIVDLQVEICRGITRGIMREYEAKFGLDLAPGMENVRKTVHNSLGRYLWKEPPDIEGARAMLSKANNKQAGRVVRVFMKDEHQTQVSYDKLAS